MFLLREAARSPWLRFSTVRVADSGNPVLPEYAARNDDIIDMMSQLLETWTLARHFARSREYHLRLRSIPLLRPPG